jgi:hypothetical protein
MCQERVVLKEMSYFTVDPVFPACLALEVLSLAARATEALKSHYGCQHPPFSYKEVAELTPPEVVPTVFVDAFIYLAL